VGYRWRSYVEETRLCYKYSGYFFLEEYVSIYSSLCIVILNLDFFKMFVSEMRCCTICCAVCMLDIREA